MKHLNELSCEELSTLLPCCDMPLPNNSPTIFSFPISTKERLSRKVKGLSVRKLASAAKQVDVLFFFKLYLYDCRVCYVCLSVCLSVCGSHNSSENRQTTAILEAVLGRLWDLQCYESWGNYVLVGIAVSHVAGNTYQVNAYWNVHHCKC